MAQGSNINNQKVSELLQEIFDFWTDISTDDDGDEVRSSASKKEAIKSRKILNNLSQMTISNEDQKSRYEDLERIITDYEETLTYEESPNGEADSLQTEIYNLWTNITYEDDTEYHSLASIEEVDLSWPIIKKIEKLDIDDEDIKAWLKLHMEISPEFEYNKKWFVTTKGGDMFFKDPVSDLPALSRKFTSEKRPQPPLGDILITEPVFDVVTNGIFPERKQKNIQHIIK